VDATAAPEGVLGTNVSDRWNSATQAWALAKGPLRAIEKGVLLVVLASCERADSRASLRKAVEAQGFDAALVRAVALSVPELAAIANCKATTVRAALDSAAATHAGFHRFAGRGRPHLIVLEGDVFGAAEVEPEAAQPSGRPVEPETAQLDAGEVGPKAAQPARRCREVGPETAEPVEPEAAQLTYLDQEVEPETAQPVEPKAAQLPSASCARSSFRESTPNGVNSTPPLYPPQGADAPSPTDVDGEPTFAQLESLALQCIPPGRTRRGAGVSLSEVARKQLEVLIDEFGAKAVERELLECGDAERPLAMCAKRLRAAKSPRPTGYRSPGRVQPPRSNANPIPSRDVFERAAEQRGPA